MNQVNLPEGQRRRCLAVMGVDLLAPRYILTGAKPSVQADILPLSDPLTTNLVNRPNTENSACDTTGPISTKHILDSIEQKPIVHELPITSAAAQSSTQQTQQAQNKSSKAVHFQLQFTNNHNGITVVTGLPGNGLSITHKRFLHALLFAIDRNTPADLQLEQFKWPLFESGEQGEVEARQALAAFLQARMAQQHLSLLVIAGMSAWRYLFDDIAVESNPFDLQVQQWQANFAKPQSLKGLHERVLLTHDINDLLEQWQLKRDLWQQVQDFI